MAKMDNPAGRLLNLLDSAKGSTYEGPAIIGWAIIFNIHVENNTLTAKNAVEVLYRLIQLQQLIDEVENSLNKIESINLDLYLRPFPRIRQAIPLTNWQFSFRQLLDQITEGDMTVLAFCSEKLSEHHVERKVNEEQLQEIQDQVIMLFEEVYSSSLPDELRNFILDQLESIRRTIFEYRVRGIKRLKEGLEASIGSLIVNSDLINKNKDYEEVRKLGMIVTGLYHVVTFAADTATLLEAFGKYLPLLLSSGK